MNVMAGLMWQPDCLPQGDNTIATTVAATAMNRRVGMLQQGFEQTGEEQIQSHPGSFHQIFRPMVA